jgi:hypothetical protein
MNARAKLRPILVPPARPEPVAAPRAELRAGRLRRNTLPGRFRRLRGYGGIIAAHVYYWRLRIAR